MPLLHWLARLVSLGEKPEFIARRIITPLPRMGVSQPGCFTGGSCCCPGRGTDRLAGREDRAGYGGLVCRMFSKSNSACVGIEKALEDVRTKMWVLYTPERFKL